MAHNPDREIPSYILDDLSTRFLNNLPEQEYSDLVRVFFQVEQAYWFFLDFYCNKSGVKPIAIKDFSEQIFRHCPVLVEHYGSYEDILRSWREYKLTVPRYGVIILDSNMEKCLLVRGMGPHSSWTFPKGKINEGESEVDCAIRETEEEIGYDTSDRINHDCYLEHKMNDQYNKLYIIRNVSLDTVFETQTRNEIRSIRWFQIDNLPAEHGNNHFLFVYPFVKKLRKWIDIERKKLRGSMPFEKAQRKTNPVRERREKKFAAPVVSGIGRGRNATKHVVPGMNTGSENDDDVASSRPHQPFSQVQPKKPGNNSKVTSSLVTSKSFGSGETVNGKRRQRYHKNNRNSVNDAGEEMESGQKTQNASDTATPIAISRSALGLIAPSQILAEEKSDKLPSDAYVASNEDAAEESDDEASDDTGDVCGFSADDQPSSSKPTMASSESSPTCSKQNIENVEAGTWQNFIPNCWRSFSFDRSLIMCAWNGSR